MREFGSPPHMAMAQFQLPKPLADNLLEHITSKADGDDPDEVMAACIREGIEEIRAQSDRVADRVKIVDKGYKNKNISEQRTIKYSQLKDQKKIFDSLKVKHEIESRRHLIREAAVAYCIKHDISGCIISSD